MAKVSFLLADNYEDSEMVNPYNAIKEAGHEVVIVGLEKGVELKGKKGASYTSDLSIDQVDANDYDAIVIPGGSAPEALRVNDQVVDFVKQANEQGKVIAGICHGPQVMISADILKGKNTKCFIGIRDVFKNAGSNINYKVIDVYSNNYISSETVHIMGLIRVVLK